MCRVRVTGSSINILDLDWYFHSKAWESSYWHDGRICGDHLLNANKINRIVKQNFWGGITHLHWFKEIEYTIQNWCDYATSKMPEPFCFSTVFWYWRNFTRQKLAIKVSVCVCESVCLSVPVWVWEGLCIVICMSLYARLCVYMFVCLWLFIYVPTFAWVSVC